MLLFLFLDYLKHTFGISVPTYQRTYTQIRYICDKLIMADSINLAGIYEL